MKLKIPKKKLYAARTIFYVSFAAALILCFTLSVIKPIGLGIAVFVAALALMLIGQHWIISMYKCPKCEAKLLYSSDRRKAGLENNCPEFCPQCGTKIIVEIVDEKME
ncbi:MAG: hypothetical protein IJ017_07550 [Oscillospiraceae bacterium]|nr:hypothetical protein [Oscillospiraceae bacterium]